MEEKHERKQPDQKTGGFYCKNRRCKPHAAAAQTPEGQQRAALVCKYSLPVTVLVSPGGQLRTETALQSPRRGLTLKLDCTFTTSQERKPRSSAHVTCYRNWECLQKSTKEVSFQGA